MFVRGRYMHTLIGLCFILIISIPFIYLSDLFFHLIQIPFALIGKWASYICLIIQLYFTSQFFNVSASYVCSYFKSNIIITYFFVSIYYLFVMYMGTADFYQKKKSLYPSASEDFIKSMILVLLSTAFISIAGYNGIKWLCLPLTYYCEFFIVLFKIPILGVITIVLLSIIPILMIIFYLPLIITLIISALVLLKNKLFKKDQSKDESQEPSTIILEDKYNDLDETEDKTEDDQWDSDIPETKYSKYIDICENLIDKVEILNNPSNLPLELSLNTEYKSCKEKLLDYIYDYYDPVSFDEQLENYDDIESIAYYDLGVV